MKAVGQLLRLPFHRMPVAGTLVLLAYLGGLAAMIGLHAPPMIAGVGAAGWLWHAMAGMTLRSVVRPETQLLPGFRRYLALAGAVGLALGIVLPLLVMLALGGTYHAPLIGALLLLAAAYGLVSGVGSKLSLVLMPALILAGWQPRLATILVKGAIQSPWTPPLLVLIAAMLVAYALRPLLRIDDREPEPSPLESTSLDRSTRAPDGAPVPRGAFAKRIAGLFDTVAQRAMERTLARYRRAPSARLRTVLVRRLLLPHDNPPAIALRLVLVAAVVALYFFAVMHRQHFNATVVGAYAILLGMARFPQLGHGMLRMRPNLADLYLTLAPATKADYQKTLIDALLVLVPVTVLTVLAYTGLGIVLVHAAEPLRMLLTAAIVAAGSALVALAVHLIGPENRLGRSAVNVVVTVAAMLLYWGGYWLLGAVGYALGGTLLALVALSFGGGVWFAAQREFQEREPRFDAPLG
ncbi:hypothetical protein [Frateuria defendens]|uniref:hypothetical protein n=1 Tax=Frateuria defendens TaxID=2219559 RepID=UPI00066FF311|nr:hypothetical protein [Frateuria defendens]